MTFTNDSDSAEWFACTVEIAGGYLVDRAGQMKPREKLTVYFSAFATRTGQQLKEDDGYARSLERVLLSCEDPEGRRALIGVR